MSTKKETWVGISLRECPFIKIGQVGFKDKVLSTPNTILLNHRVLSLNLSIAIYIEAEV